MQISTIIILVSYLLNVSAQTSSKYSTHSQKAIAFFENSLKFYNTGSYESCLEELKKAIEADSMFVESYMLMSEIYHQQENRVDEINCYERILSFNPENKPQILYYLSEAQYLSGMYKEANYNVQKSLAGSGLTQAMRNDARWLLAATKFAIESVKQPVDYKPESLGVKLNSKYNDYWPSLTADDATMIFTSEVPSRHPNSTGKYRLQEDLYISKLDDSEEWSSALELGEPINTDENEGGQSISFDGRYLFFTSCNRSGLGRCDLYYSERIGQAWTKPQNLGAPVNSKAWESQPSLSSDGRTLYFVSNRPGGKGGKDIWMTHLDDYGVWSRPVNLGDSINTPDDEMSPFIHMDNQTLYFSSNGHIGMGKQDVFISRKIDGEWGNPQNLGYPINTHNDEYGFVVNSGGTTAYFSSDRILESQRDIYSFVMPQELRPHVVNYVKGVVFDPQSKKHIKADLELSDLETSLIVAQTKSIEGTGEYLVCLPVDRDYGLNISKDGYLFHSENFSLKGQKDISDPFLLNIELQTIKVGGKEILRNIFYETDSYLLKATSRFELNKLIDFMNNNPKVHVEIGGHTDNVGGEEHNQVLSENRARVVYEYLINKGVNKSKLTYRGYSYKEPVATNENVKGRAQNRRTEFKIVKIEE